MRKFFSLALAAAFVFAGCSSDDDNNDDGGGNGDGGGDPIQAVYRVTFSPNFIEDEFPVDYPANAAFSQILVAAHAPGERIFNVGAPASEGLKTLAEEGAVGSFRGELALEGTEDNVTYRLVNSANGGGATAEQSVNITVDPDKTSISFIVSLTPSPDWFLASLDLSIIGDDGNSLIELEEFGVEVYDAGTDSGDTYASPDTPTTPAGPVAEFEGPPIFPAGGGLAPSIGTITLERIDL